MGGVVRNDTVAAGRPGTAPMGMARPPGASTFVAQRPPTSSSGPLSGAGSGAGAAAGGRSGSGPHAHGGGGGGAAYGGADSDSDGDDTGARALRAKLAGMGIDDTVTPVAAADTAAAAAPPAAGGMPDRAPDVRPRLDVRDKRSFLGHAPPKVGMIQCFIQRDKSGLKKLHPEYSLFLDRPSAGGEPQFLLAGRKRKKNKTSNYLISMDREDLHRNSGNFYGKVRSNFVGTEFTVYDKGEKPSKEGGLQQRQEMAAVLYQTNILGSKGPRQMHVLVPRVDDATGKRGQWKQDQEDSEMLITAFKNSDHPRQKEVMALENKKPSWNEELRAYVLNFGGRVTVASVKNFQLVEKGSERVLVQFGKIGSDTFNLDFQYPICGLQAFAVALTAFDNKLACE